jgi:hypothetical protein
VGAGASAIFAVLLAATAMPKVAALCNLLAGIVVGGLAFRALTAAERENSG